MLIVGPRTIVAPLSPCSAPLTRSEGRAAAVAQLAATSTGAGSHPRHRLAGPLRDRRARTHPRARGGRGPAAARVNIPNRGHFHPAGALANLERQQTEPGAGGG